MLSLCDHHTQYVSQHQDMSVETLLFTRPHTLFWCYSFPPHAPSAFQDLIQDSTLHLLVKAPLAPDSFSDDPCYLILDTFGLVSPFVQCLSS